MKDKGTPWKPGAQVSMYNDTGLTFLVFSLISSIIGTTAVADEEHIPQKKVVNCLQVETALGNCPITMSGDSLWYVKID